MERYKIRVSVRGPAVSTDSSILFFGSVLECQDPQPSTSSSFRIDHHTRLDCNDIVI